MNPYRLLRATFWSLLFLGSASTALVAQSDYQNEAYLEQVGDLNEIVVIQRNAEKQNSAVARQLGEGNRAELEQVQSFLGDEANRMNLVQSGHQNAAKMRQDGSGNHSSANQYGNQNDFELDILGDKNRSFLLQSGNNNSVFQELTGDELNYSVIQRGNNLEVVQIENGERAKSYEIQQRGNGMKIIIVNGGLPGTP
ncbi:MAG: hypothetical protein CL946_12070 [Ectothiorhodospiraceae bacterium]|nr:hypothetical protein [Ectothiorhodospiraceae bacterium]